MKPIILNGRDYTSCQIKFEDGPYGYIGVEVHDPRLTAPANLHFLEDKDVARLIKALQKVQKSIIKRRKKK